MTWLKPSQPDLLCLKSTTVQQLPTLGWLSTSASTVCWNRVSDVGASLTYRKGENEIWLSFVNSQFFFLCYVFKDNYFFTTYLSKRLNYVNHARRLADGDWTGAESDGEEDMEKQQEGKQEQDGSAEEEGMDVDRRKLPKNYANQVSAWYVFFLCIKELRSFQL